MKKIVLAGLFCMFFINVFSQESLVYEKLQSTEEKLDFIYENILKKQISDYKKIEDEKIKLENQLNSLRENIKNKELESLKSEKKKLEDDLEKLKDNLEKLNNDIFEKDQQISKLKKIEAEFSKFKSIEKNRIENEIEEIFVQKELISEDLLKSIRDKAVVYKIDQKLISRLNSFIDITNTITKAQNLLYRRIDQSEIDKCINSFKDIRNNEFDFLNKKIKSLEILLEYYCDKSLELFDMLKKVDTFGLSEKELKYELKKKRSLFLSFPYLSNEINKKIEDLNYSSQVQECY